MELHAIHESPVLWVADRLASLGRASLSRAIVLTSSERLAHAIRRELCVVRARPDAVTGVAFLRPVDLACRLLARVRRVRRPGWEVLRLGRVLHGIHSDAWAGSLAYFDLAQLRSGAGYADALIEAISELESGALTPEDLDSVASQLTDDRRAAARLRDLATIWRRADEACGDGRSSACILVEAAELLGRSQDKAPVAPLGKGQLSFADLAAVQAVSREPPPADVRLPPTFAVVDATPSAALLAFLRALPRIQIVFQDARPVRTATHRWRRVAGVEPARPAARFGTDELSVARRFLFETPEVLADPARARSPGADGSVDLEEYAGVEEEIDAAAVWVAEQIAAGIALDRIAIVTPDKAMYAVLVVDRLARLRPASSGLSVAAYVAGGLPLAFTAAGRRLRTLLDAVASGLEMDATLRLIPALRRAGQSADVTATRLSPSRAAEVVYEAGIAGSGPRDRDGAREWLVKLQAHRDRLAALVAEVEREAAPDRVRTVNAQAAHRWLRDVEPILPAVEALVELADRCAEGAGFGALWQGIQGFCRRFLLLPPDPPGLLERMAEAFAPALADPAIASLPAPLALRWIEQRLRGERQGHGRFGEARVFVGTPAQAAGLEFDAVRILGLAEGGLPRTAHDDPIVPDGLRARIDEILQRRNAAAVVPRLADRVLDDLHGVFRVIAGTRRTLALSVPRQWIDRSEREISGIVLEVATALARVRDAEGDVPTAGRLRSGYFVLGDAARAAARRHWPIASKSLLVAVLPGSDDGTTVRVPAAWVDAGPVCVVRARALTDAESSDAPGLVDGVLGAVWAQVPRLGTRARPLSASALSLLLGCPHRFLLERILHWREPPRRPPTDVIEPGAYGTTFHRAAELLLREAGPQICRREGSAEWWAGRARAIAAAEFDALLGRYPLRGEAARGRERQRFLAQVESLVRDEWERPARTFVAAELGFGRDVPVELDAGAAGAIHLWGAIDRVDRLADGTLSVRDIKTGRVRDLAEEEVNAARDLQIGVYMLVAEVVLGRGAAEASPRASEAVYVHPSAAQEPERAFRAAQLDGLRQRTRQWLRVAGELIAAGRFVRTSNADDCWACPFVPVCGANAQARSQAKLAVVGQSDPLAAFAALKREIRFED